MGVYTNNSSLALEAGEIECKYEPGLEAALNMVAESESNYNKLMQAIGIHELNVLESTGAEMVYEAGDIKSLAESVKKFFLNIWEKIKGLFKKFFALFDGYIKSDKEFIRKYKKDLMKLTNTKDYKYKGYEFENLNLSLDSVSSKM